MTHTGINAQGVQRVRDHLARLPRPDREAQKALASWLHSQGISLEPDAIDVVTLHLQPQASGRYHAQIVQRTRLPQAVLINWQGESANDFFGALMAAPWAGHFPTDGAIDVVEALDPLPPLSNSSPYVVFNGLFQRCEPARFDTSTLIDIPAESLQRHIESLDFHTRYKKQLEHYWQAHLDEYRLCSKLNVVAACNKQVAEGSLGEAARRLVWQATDLLARSPTFQARWLNIYGYVSTDLLCLHDTHSDLTVLYVPGNSAPLLEFASQDLLRDWIGEQCKDALKRRHLKRHFRLADGPQGVDFSGLDTAMEGLGVYPRRHRLPPEHGFFNDDGKWPPRTYVQYRPDTYSPALEGDLFQALAERQRQRSLDDADFLITSTGEVRERRWRHYLTNTLNLLLPLSFVVPGLAPLLAVGGIVQLGVGLDEAINGKTLHDKLDGIGDITYGLFNAVPGLASVTRDADGLFQTWREGFVVPTRLDGQIGYPLSPLDPPHWPEVDIAPFFDRPLRIESLVDGDPGVAKAISRYPRYDGRNDILRGYYEPAPGYLDTLELVYDMQTNLFLLEDELNEVEPQYYEPDLGTGNLRKTSTANREVTDAMRTATLRALGIDLPLPVELPPPVPQGATPLLKQITALWVGDKQLEAPVLENLAHNARALTDSAYRYRLMLSRRSTEAFAYNLAQLESQVPGLEVLVLEDQDFYRSFEQSPNYAHYQAALGDGGQTSNYASAADVLRYPMLHSEGGIYMDVDDTLVLDPDTGKAALAEVELAATPEGLLLQPPVQNDLMGLDSAYNNSMIGSHAGNPTLLAVSQEMHARYLATVEPYPLRPDRLTDPAAFKHYARQVSRLTGPGLFTDVIDRTLPDLYRLRQLEHLYMIPRINSYQFIDLDEVNALRTARFPLARLAQIGRLHSWA